MSLFRNARWSRREVLKQSGILSALGAATAVSPFVGRCNRAGRAAATHPLPAREGTDQDNLFTRIGVRPLINGRGTFTIISGSRSLPQVKQAMYRSVLLLRSARRDDGWNRRPTRQAHRRRVGHRHHRLRGCHLLLPPSRASPEPTSSAVRPFPTSKSVTRSSFQSTRETRTTSACV